MILAIIVRLGGGFWRVRQRAQQPRGQLTSRLTKILYTQYLQSLGSYIGLDAQIAGPITFPHKPMGIFIAPGATIGSNCTIYQQVTVGENNTRSSKNFGSPHIGDDVYIGAGAKIIGNVLVGSGAKIGANATVVKDVPSGATVVPSAGIILLDGR